MIGTKLAHYEVTGHLGTGGMGEVYQATDSKLGRSVAIKLLPEAFTHDRDRAARFEREARVLASLNHPNIAAIYGIEESGARKFLVMELVGGETLAERIKRGAIPVDEALPIAKQIAEGLEAAHEKGIVHRDLKPANIKVTPQGHVKVLDFGLAKAFAGEDADVNLSKLPTLSMAATKAGVILGTAAYMSPEQAKGHTVDKRSDVWAFGCVLFEMLTARRAFPGEGVSETLAAVLKSDPDWTTLPAVTPMAVRRLLRRCLEKDSRQRLADIADARLEIQEAMAQPETLAPAALGHRRARWIGAIPWAVAALSIAVTLLITQNGLLNTPSPNRPVIRAELNLPAGLELYSGTAPSAALSPDGIRIVFIGVAGGVRQLYVRRLDQFEAIPLIGTETAQMSFFSQDGKAVGFVTTDRILRKVTLADGQVVPLAYGVDVNAGGAWGTDDRITFGRAGALWQVSASGGDPTQLTKLDTVKGELFHARPAVVAGGKAILFQSVSGSSCDATHIEALSLADGRTRPVVDGTYPLYTESGHLIFFHDGTLFAAPFDAQQLKLTGPAVRLAENVAVDQLGQPIIAISASGSMVYAAGGTGTSLLVLVSRDGVQTQIIDTLRNYYFPRLEPINGRRIVVAVNASLWIIETARPTSQPLSAGGCASSYAVWGPDGKYVVFRTPTGMRRIDVDSNGPSVAISGSTSAADFPTSIYGDTLAFLRQTEDKSGDVYVLSLRGESQPQAVVSTSAYEGGPQFSPDGKWLAYVSNKSDGKYQVYVRGYPGVVDVPVSTQGGSQPVWNPKGGELFYRDGNKMMAAKVSTKPDLRVISLKQLFDQRYVFYSTTLAHYDVSADGESFVMLKDESGSGRLNLVLNWLDELKLRVAAH